MGTADLLLLFCSPNSLNSKPVEEEWTNAKAMGKPIIPIFVKPDHIPARIFLARLYISQNKIKQAWSELEAISHLEIIDPELAGEYGGLVDSLKAL